MYHDGELNFSCQKTETRTYQYVSNFSQPNNDAVVKINIFLEIFKITKTSVSRLL